MLERKPSEKCLLCLDIGTSSIKACVFEENDEILEMKVAAYISQQRGNVQSGSIINLAQTIHNVGEVVKKVENQAKLLAKDVVIGVSGELVKGITETLEFVRNDAEKRIDMQELKSIIYELQWQAFDLIRARIADEMSLPEIELKLINAAIVSIRVDGQEVNDPVGMTGAIVGMEIFNCFSPVQHFGQIQNIAVELPFHELKGVFIQSFAICHSLLLQNTLASAIVIDIGAGTTDLGVISNGKIVGNRSFAMGGDSLTKRLSHELSTSFEEAESIKLKYAEDALEKKSHKVIHDALLDDIEIWLSSLDFCLKELSLRQLPSLVLLCGKSSLIPEFKEALRHHPWAEHFPTDGKMEVRPLQYSDILKGEFEEQSFEVEYLPLVAVANTAHDLLYNNSSVEGILNAIIADKGI